MPSTKIGIILLMQEVEPESRTVCFHYHIYKCAGSSVIHGELDGETQPFVELDRDPRYDAPHHDSRVVVRAARENPKVDLYTSHRAGKGTHLTEDIKVLPILFVRHPLLHAASIYRFERKRSLAGIHSKLQHKLAGQLAFNEWIDYNINTNHSYECKNYQTTMIFDLPYVVTNRVNSVLKELDNVHFYKLMIDKYLRTFPTVGLVEKFNESARSFNKVFEDEGLKFRIIENTMRNTTRTDRSPEEILEETESELSPSIAERFYEKNQLDYHLYRKVSQLYES